LIGKDVVLGRIARQEDDGSMSNGYEYYSNRELIKPMTVPAGFSHMEWIAWSRDFEIDGDTMTIVVESKTGVPQTFTVSVKALIALDQEKWTNESPANLIFKNSDAQLVVSQFSLSVNDKGQVDFLNFEGLLFTR